MISLRVLGIPELSLHALSMPYIGNETHTMLNDSEHNHGELYELLSSDGYHLYSSDGYELLAQ